MSETAFAQSPLTDFPDTGQPGLAVRELPEIAYLNLRGQPDDERFVRAAEKAIGIVLPLTPNTVNRNEQDGLLWLAPTEWLLVTRMAQKQTQVHNLGESLNGLFAGVTDVSGYYTTLSIAGRDARAVLARGCPLDLHPRVFGPDQCAQTLFAKATMMLHQTDGSPAFHMIVRRSFADYVWRWLQDAITSIRNS